jgi:hypothetical protein
MTDNHAQPEPERPEHSPRRLPGGRLQVRLAEWS